MNYKLSNTRLALVYLNKGGGIGHCALQLAKALSGIAETTFYTTTANPFLEEYQKAIPDRVRAFDMPRGWKVLIRSMISNRLPAGIVDSIRNDNPDIVIDLGSLLWVQVLQRELAGKYPFAEVIHDPSPHRDRRYLIYAIPALLYPTLADIYISMSDYGYRELIRIYPRKLHIASRHGVILRRKDPDPKEVAQRRQKQLFFGRITQYKGLDVLIDAYRIARGRDPQLQLTVCGKGVIKAGLRKTMREFSIELKNKYVTDDEIMDLMNSNGVLLLPYTSATQSGVASAALANGLPAIATSVGALPEQVIDGRNGIIVPPHNPRALAEAMLSIASEQKKAEEMSRQAIMVANELYSWDRIGEKLLKDIDKALDSLGHPQ